MNAADYLQKLGSGAKTAARVLNISGALARNSALDAIAEALVRHTETILDANKTDIEHAEQNGIRPVMVDRLRLTGERVLAMAEGVRDVMRLPDPLGEIIGGTTRPNGLEIRQVRVPLGVVGMIYESRPNVTVDAASLCLKSGNACILRGGKEAIHTNSVLARVMREAVESSGLPSDCIQLIEDTSRESASEMMRLNRFIDVLIPRGGAGLIRSVKEHSTVPVIETGVGNCHVYVDETADLDMAAQIIENAKCSRPSVCNAAESLLVHKAVAEQFLPMAKTALDAYHVELRGCERTMAILGPCVVPATEADYATEYNDYILAVKVVDSLEEAIEHINRYGTGHSEAIVTNSYAAEREFTARVDAAAVYVNASTRFTDGGEFGLGAEIGISTQKLHARGPMGLKALTTVKHIILGSGQIR